MVTAGKDSAGTRLFSMRSLATDLGKVAIISAKTIFRVVVSALIRPYLYKGLQRDVVYLGLVYEPKCGALAGPQPMSTAEHMEPK
jgi:hypothetical protein